MAQNEMKVKRGLPLSARSMERLGRNAQFAEKNIFGQALRGEKTVQT